MMKISASSIYLLLLHFVIYADVSNALSLDTRKIPYITSFKKTIIEPITERTKILELTCSTNPIRNVDINFYHNDVIINRNASRVQNLTLNKIYIKDIKEVTDDGVYKCVACNYYGCSMAKLDIEIPVIGKFTEGNRFDDAPKYVDAHPNYQLEIICPHHTLSRPLTVRWGRKLPTRFLEESENVNFVDDNKIIYVSNVTTDFIDTINKDFQGIRCVLQTNQRLIYSAKIILRLDTAALEYKPKVYRQFSKNVFIEDGESFTFKCLGMGNPQPNITWYRNNERIIPGTYLFEMDEDYATKLTIKRFDRRYEGKYACVLENGLGKATTEGNLTLAEKPKIFTPLHSVGSLKNNTINISCEAYGTEPLQLTWLKDGIPVESDSRKTANEGRLVLRYSNVSDSGTYECVASNKFGTDSKTINIIIVSTEWELAKLLDTVPALRDSSFYLHVDPSCFILILLAMLISYCKF